MAAITRFALSAAHVDLAPLYVNIDYHNALHRSRAAFKLKISNMPNVVPDDLPKPAVVCSICRDVVTHTAQPRFVERCDTQHRLRRLISRKVKHESIDDLTCKLERYCLTNIVASSHQQAVHLPVPKISRSVISADRSTLLPHLH